MEFIIENLYSSYNLVSKKLFSLSPIQLGIGSGILTLIAFKLLLFFIQNTNFTWLFFSLIQFFIVAFCIFSFFTWYTLIHDINDSKRGWSHPTVYFIFVTCVFSEFLNQIILFHLNNQSTDNKKIAASTSNDDTFNFILIENLLQTCLIGFVCVLVNFFLVESSNLNELVVFISLTRFYATCSFASLLPSSISAHFSYLCALCGILFSYYLKHLFNVYNYNNDLMIVNNAKLARQKFVCNDCENDNEILMRKKRVCAFNNSSSDFNNSNNKNKPKRTNNNFKLFNDLLSQRRTSLPTISIKNDKPASDKCFLSEIQTIVDNMLNGNNAITLSEKCLKNLNKIHNLLIKTNLNHGQFSTNNNNNNNNSSCFMNNEDNESNFSSPFFFSNQTSPSSSNELTKHMRHRNRRSLPAIQISRRSSAFTYPLFDQPPIVNSTRNRSLSLRIPSSNQTTSSSSTSTTNAPTSSATTSTINNQNSLLNYLSRQLIERSVEAKSNENLNDDEQLSTLPTSITELNNKTSDYDSGESPNSSDYNSDTDKLQLKENHFNYHHHNENLANSIKKLDEIDEEELFLNSYGIRREKGSFNGVESVQLEWQLDELNNAKYLDYLHDWNFPIFQFYENTQNFILSKMAFKIFQEVGLFKSFDIPVNEFIHFFTALEKGYIDLPYHNKIHAADVLHACYYLTSQAVPGFTQIDSATTLKNSKERSSLGPYQHSSKYSLNNEIYGCLGANFTPLELLALYCSAAMHDYEHPGRNNQFLVTISSPLALLYNDKSVLENHHASASWRLLKSKPQFNFLKNLDAAEWKRFRFLVLEYILATDLNKHFSIIGEFNNKVKAKVKNTTNPAFNCSSMNSLDWKNDNDRLIVGEMIIKLADISAPLKEKELHTQWTDRICEEFYLQGEEEARRGLAISPFMDRKKPQVEILQENFINALVGSLVNAYTSAGLLPGILIEDSEATDDSSEADVENLSMDDDDEFSNDDRSPTTANNKLNKKPKKIFYSELLSNLKANYEMWCERIKQLEQQAKSNV